MGRTKRKKAMARTKGSSKNIRDGMRRCTNCHEWKLAIPENFYPATSSSPDGFIAICRICQRKQARIYHYEHRERNNERRAKAREIERQSRPIKEKVKLTPEEMVIRKKEYYRRYMAKRRALKPKPEQPPNKIYPDSKSQKRAGKMRRKAIKRSLPQTFTQKEWGFALAHFNNSCAICGRPPGLWHTLSQDHWIPMVRGGGYTADNIVPLCYGQGGCNNSKCSRDPAEWLTQKFGARKAKQILAKIEQYFNTVRERETA